VLVVSALSESGGDGVPATADDAAVGHDEVTRIFMEERVEEDTGDDAANQGVAIVGGIDSEIAADAGAVFGVGIVGQLNAGADAGGGEEDRIGGRADGELELLAHGERRRVPDIAGVVVGKDAEDALVELVVKLGFGDLLFGEGDGSVGSGAGDGQGDLGELVVFAGLDVDVAETQAFKAGRGDGDGVGAGGEIGKAEAAEAVGGDLLRFFGGGAGTLCDDVSAGDETALNVADDAGDAAESAWSCRQSGVLWRSLRGELWLRSLRKNIRKSRTLREKGRCGDDKACNGKERNGSVMSGRSDFETTSLARIHIVGTFPDDLLCSSIIRCRFFVFSGHDGRVRLSVREMYQEDGKGIE